MFSLIASCTITFGFLSIIHHFPFFLLWFILHQPCIFFNVPSFFLFVNQHHLITLISWYVHVYVEREYNIDLLNIWKINGHPRKNYHDIKNFYKKWKLFDFTHTIYNFLQSSTKINKITHTKMIATVICISLCFVIL